MNSTKKDLMYIQFCKNPVEIEETCKLTTDINTLVRQYYTELCMYINSYLKREKSLSVFCNLDVKLIIYFYLFSEFGSNKYHCPLQWMLGLITTDEQVTFSGLF